MFWSEAMAGMDAEAEFIIHNVVINLADFPVFIYIQVFGEVHVWDKSYFCLTNTMIKA